LLSVEKEIVMGVIFFYNEEWLNDKNGANVLGEDWMSFRYDLFVKTCFNSIKYQTCQNFKWLVYFDVDTDSYYKNRNKELQKEFPNFIPLYKASNKLFLEELSQDIKIHYLYEETEFLITSRIDNDDAFHKDAIKIIQKQFDGIANKVINLSNIFCYNINDFTLTRYNFKSNPFVSVIENKEELTTVFSKNHNYWKKDNKYSILNVEGEKVYCLQLIHDRNILNQNQGFKKYYNKLNEDFNLLIPINFSCYYVFTVFFQNILIKLLKKIKRCLNL